VRRSGISNLWSSEVANSWRPDAMNLRNLEVRESAGGQVRKSRRAENPWTGWFMNQ
jgi:hypothetical protein